MALPASGSTITMNQVQTFFGRTSASTVTLRADLGPKIGITSGAISLSSSFGGLSFPVITSGLALYLDAADTRSYSNNVAPNSTDLFVLTGPTGNACTFSRSTPPIGASPVGGTPVRMAVTGNDPHSGSYNSAAYNFAPAAAGQTWTLSVYITASVATTAELFLFGVDSTGNAFGAGTNFSANTVSVTTGWTRVSFTYTFAAGATGIRFVQCRLDGPNSGGAGINVYWDGLQIEQTSSPTTFNPITNTGGVSWFDLSGNGRTGTLVGSPVFTSGYFDITSDSTYISIPNAGLVPRTGDFTYSCWVRFDAIDGADTIFENGFWTDTLLFRAENSSVVVYSEGAARGSFAWARAINIWYNIVFKRESNTTSLYINGTLTGSPFTMALDINLANPNLWLMRSQHTTGQFTNGKIAQFLIYTRALSAAEITRNFEATRSKIGV